MVCEISKPPFLQLIGKPGSGAHRLVFEFLELHQQVAWISTAWKLYAPSLWQLAAEKKIKILAIECPDKKKRRSLFKSLYEANAGGIIVFHVWIIDELALSQAEGRFLQTLLRHQKNIKIIVIDSFAHTFCQERIHCSLQHDSYRMLWSKGGTPKSIFHDFPFKEDLCSL